MLPYRFFSVCSILPLSLLIIFYQLSAALAQLQVQLNLYTDNQCQIASTQKATVSISISICIVTIGLGSISHSSVPCSNGNVQLLGFSDTACGTQLDLYSKGNTCIGPYRGDVAAVMLTCAQEDNSGNINPGTPTTTSTISVGPVADAAPTATKSVSGSSSSVTATQTAASSSPSSSGGASANDNGTGGANPSSSSSSSRLSTSDIISLAVGLGVGIPTVILSYLAVRWARIRYNMRRENPQENAYSLGLISTGEVYR